MRDLKTTLNKLKELKAKRAELAKILKVEKDQLYTTTDIPRLEETLRVQRKLAKEILEEENRHLIEQMEDLKIDIETEKELLSDIALSMLMKGEPVSVETEDGQYEPSFTVNFKRL